MELCEEVRNTTLSYLIKHYPQSLGNIPEEVLYFGLPDRISTLVFGAFNALFLVISLFGNSIMFYLYWR